MAIIQILPICTSKFQPWQPVPTAADVVVLAGDIHCGGQTVGWVKQAFPDRPVVLVLGNHDYWNHTDINGALDKAREETAGTHIHLLEKTMPSHWKASGFWAARCGQTTG